MGGAPLRIARQLLGSFVAGRQQHGWERPAAGKVGALVDEVCRGRYGHISAIAVLAINRVGSW